MVNQSRKLLENGDLHLLEDGGERLLERTRRNLYWHNLSGDGELSNRANYAQDAAGTIVVTPVPTDDTVPARDGYRYYRLVTDGGTAGGNFIVNQIDLWNLVADTSIWSVMSDNTTPAPQVASASSNNVDAWQVFDGDPTGTGWDSGTSAGGSWVKLDIGSQTPVRLVRVWFSSTEDEQPADWWLEGSNDDSNWTRLAGQAIPQINFNQTNFKALLNPEQQLIAYQGQVLDQIDADDRSWYWTFDDGTATDLSLNGLDGSLVGNFTTDGPLIAKAGSSIVPQDPGSYIIQDSQLFDDFDQSAFSCWFQKPDDTLRRLLFGRGDAAEGGMVVYLETDGSLRAGVWDGADTVFVSVACSSGAMHDVGAFFAAGVLYLYLDGQLAAWDYNPDLDKQITVTGAYDLVAGSNRSLKYHDGDSSAANTAINTLIDEAWASDLAFRGPDYGSLWLAGLGYQNQIYADTLIFDDTAGGGAASVATSTTYVPAYSLEFDSAVQDQLVLGGGSRMDVDQWNHSGGHQQPLDLTSSGDLTIWQTIDVSGQPVGTTTVIDTTGTLRLQGTITAAGDGDLVEVRGPATAIGDLLVTGSVSTRLANAVTDGGLGLDLQSFRTAGETRLDEEVLFEDVIIRQGLLVYEVSSATVSGPARNEVVVPADGAGTPRYVLDLLTAGVRQYTGDYSTDLQFCALEVRDSAPGGTMDFSGDFSWRFAGVGTLFLDTSPVDGLFDVFSGDLLDVSGSSFDIHKLPGRTLFFDPASTHEHRRTYIAETGVGDGSLQGIGLKWDAPGTPGVKTRGFGDLIVCTSAQSAGTFQLRHFLGGVANRVEFTTPILNYGVPMWLALGPISGSNPTYTVLQQLAIGETVTVDFGDALGTSVKTIEILEIVQATAETVVLTINGDDAVDAELVIGTTLRSEATEAPGSAGNDLNLSLLDTEPASQVIRFDGVDGSTFSQGDVVILETQTEWVEFAGTSNINTDLLNTAGQVRMAASAVLTVDNYQQLVAGTALDAGASSVMNAAIFQITGGDFTIAAGATWNVGRWLANNVDAVSASPWFVNAAILAQIDNGNLQNSDASGGVMGQILSGATDLGGNINWSLVPNIESPHVWYPDGYPRRAFDLRWVISYTIVDGQALVRFFGNPHSVLSFSATSFLGAWFSSRLNDPSLPGDPAISGFGPQFQVGATVYNGTMIDMWGPHPTDSTRLLIWVSSMSAEDDGGIPVNEQVEVDKAEFEFQIGTSYPWWSPDGSVYYNLDRVVTWSTVEPTPVRFDSPQKNTLLPDLADFETNMQSSKDR